MARPFLSAWLAGDPAALELVAAGVRSPERAAIVARAAKRIVAPELYAALGAHHRELPTSLTRLANLEALALDHAAAIVSGQQVGLFGGPLFTFYKAASAIVLARALSAETRVPCVPVFWLQTEDHDYAEIASVTLPGGTTIALPVDDRRPSVAHRTLGAVLEPALVQLEHALAGEPHAADTMQLLRDAYRPERTIASAFAHLFAGLFAEEGLVLIDPRRPDVGALTAPILQRAIRERVAIDHVLDTAARALAQAGFAAQVTTRPGSPLCFYHLDEVAGPRHRLEPHGDGYAVEGRAIDPSALVDAPSLRLSSSALLRPIVQDALLPTAFYVGGPAELAYFAQLGPLYRHFGMTPTGFALRARLRLLDPTIRSLLDRTGVAAADVEAPRDVLLARLARSEQPDAEVLRARLLDPMHRELDAIAALGVDANLVSPIARTRETIDHAVARLLDRYARARVEHDEIAVDRVDRLRAALFPDDVPQERAYGLPWFLARHGVAAFKRAVLAAIDPFAPVIRDVEP